MATVPELSEFAVDVTSEGGKEIVRLRGDADVYTAPVLERRLNELVDDGAREIVIDLAELTFIDTTGLSVLVGTHRRLRAHDGRIRLRSPSGSVQKVLEITGLDRVLVGG